MMFFNMTQCLPMFILLASASDRRDKRAGGGLGSGGVTGVAFAVSDFCQTSHFFCLITSIITCMVVVGHWVMIMVIWSSGHSHRIIWSCWHMSASCSAGQWVMFNKPIGHVQWITVSC